MPQAPDEAVAYESAIESQRSAHEPADAEPSSSPPGIRTGTLTTTRAR